MKLAFQQLWDFFEKHSRNGPAPMGWGTRIAAGILVMSTIIFVVLGSSKLMDSDRYLDPQGISLSGDWEFHNGPSAICADPLQPSGQIPCVVLEKTKKWSFRVEVPKPLAAQIKEPLASEFWYRKTIQLNQELLTSADDLSITVGSTKGKHRIWVNGHYLASGAELSLANHSLPRFLLGKNGTAEIIVNVFRTDTLFPGIVHTKPMQIGRTKYLAKQTEDFYFQMSSKPLIPAIFKGVLFLAFIALFIAMPIRREYIFFSLYCFFSASTSFFYWSYQPFYENYFLRQQLIFVATMASLACIPLFVTEFFRFGSRVRYAATIYSLFLFAMPLLSLAWIEDNAKRIFLYQQLYELVPWIVYMPAFGFSLFCSIFIMNRLRIRHRALQGFFLASCFVLNILFSGGTLSKFFSLHNFYAKDFLDIAIFSSLAFLMIGDFKSLNAIFQKSREAIPSLVGRLISAGVKEAIVEFHAVALVVDVVGYTQKLATVSGAERDRYNSTIKDLLAPLVQEFGGEKISDTGDGAVYVWEIKSTGNETQSVEGALKAGLEIVRSGTAAGLNFRLGVARGVIKCHFHAPNFSFLGDPINIASRLEAAAAVNQILVHESVAALGGALFVEGEFKTYIMKGAPFLARPIYSMKSKLRLVG